MLLHAVAENGGGDGKRAGVSMGTASNAFNRPELLSEDARERVLRAASALRYAGPDPAGRRLRTGRSGALGVIFTDRLSFAFGDQAAREAAGHLRGLGHERVAVLSFAETAEEAGEFPFDVTRERLAGYRDGLGDAHVDVRICRPNLPETGRAATLELLAAAEPPTAVLAMSDALALGALQAARERGVEVPGGLSVVGFDDSPAAAMATPGLTTVRQPQERKGRLAAEALLAAMEGAEAASTPTILPTELVERGSTGPPTHS